MVILTLFGSSIVHELSILLAITGIAASTNGLLGLETLALGKFAMFLYKELTGILCCLQKRTVETSFL